MKITKLFHWLYAVLMLLPVFFIAGVSLYTIFNQNAKDSYYGETINEQQFVNPTQFVANQEYHIYLPSSLEFTRQSSTTDFLVSNVKVNDTEYNINTLRFYVSEGTTRLYIQGYNNPSNGESFIITSGASSNYEIVFTYLNENNSNYDSQTLQVTKKIEYNKYSFLDNSFIYSINQLNEVPLFSWAQNSFLSVPFNYITGLFGMQSTNPVNTLLSYWLSISVIWLVFDLIMYVPLLVHRWIDKAVID